MKLFTKLVLRFFLISGLLLTVKAVTAGASNYKLMMSSIDNQDLVAFKKSIVRDTALLNTVAASAYDMWPLCELMMVGNEELLKFAIAQGADINLRSVESSFSQSAPILCAIVSNNMPVFDLLLELDVDLDLVECRNCSGVKRSPLLTAAATGSYEMAYKILMRAESTDDYLAKVSDYMDIVVTSPTSSTYQWKLMVAQEIERRGIAVSEHLSSQ